MLVAGHNVTFDIEPDGTGRAIFGVSQDGTYTTFIGYYTVAIKDGEPDIEAEFVGTQLVEVS